MVSVLFPPFCILIRFQVQVEINWEDIMEYHVVDGGRAFQFSFRREGKRAKPIKLISNYVSCLL